jgi:hypothetical protein
MTELAEVVESLEEEGVAVEDVRSVSTEDDKETVRAGVTLVFTLDDEDDDTDLRGGV